MKTASRTWVLALRQSANALKASRFSPNKETRDEALEQFFCVLEGACEAGFSINGYNIAPGSRADARMLQQLIPALLLAPGAANSPRKVFPMDEKRA